MKIKIAIIISILISSCFVSTYAADKITIQGSVFDKASDTQLFVADVKLLNFQDSTIVT